MKKECSIFQFTVLQKFRRIFRNWQIEDILCLVLLIAALINGTAYAQRLSAVNDYVSTPINTEDQKKEIASNQRLSFVNGYVVVSVSSEGKKRKEIALPHAEVFLVDDKNRNPVASTTTDLSGRFNLKTDKTGIYQICVKAEGFTSRCSRNEFRLSGNTYRFGTFLLPIVHNLKAETAHAWGRVELKDGSSIRTFEPYMSINAYGTVELVLKNKVKYRAYINNFDEYVIPQVPVGKNFALRVVAEKEVVIRHVDKLTNLQPNRNYSFDFSLTNTPPELRLISAHVGNKPVQEVLAGDEIEVRAVAQDLDDDNLQYYWHLPDGKIFGPVNESSFKWRAPTRKGRYQVTAMVSDNRGGYAKRSFPIEVGDNSIPFSGIVVDTHDNPVIGAQVDINGHLFHTNSKGRIRVQVPVSDRYVFTIRKDGVTTSDSDAYGTASFIYRRAVQDGRWVLRRAQVFTVDPTQPIGLRQSRKFRDCAKPRSEQINWERFLNPRLFQWQNGRGQALSIADVANREKESFKRILPIISNINPALVNVFLATAIPARRDTKDDRITIFDHVNNSIQKGRKGSRRKKPGCEDGIQVEIPANSLVDQATGSAPSGKLRIALSSVEVNASQMPGDFSAIDENNTAVMMESFGAGSIEVGDGSRRFNLAPGKNAMVSIPLDRSQITGGAIPDTTIPFLFFNESKGIWEQEGVADLIGSGASAMYKKKVSHFSTINADILKSGQSCVAVEVDPDAGFVSPLQVEITMQPSVVNPEVIQVRTETIDISQSNVIYNLPNNSDIALTPIVEGVRPDGSTGSVPAGVFVVNTGGPQTSPGNLPTPNPDGTYYSESSGVPTGPCGSRVVLTNLVAPEPAGGYEFLQGLFFQSSNITELHSSDTAVEEAIIAGAEAYYDKIDPRNKRNSFNLFQSENDFGEPFDAGELEWDSEFANSGDLGFGRDMHCRRNNGGDGQFDYACYVTNFGQPPLDLPDQVDADNAHDGLSPDATVAMEYSRVENPFGVSPEFPDNERAVKFYVYNTTTPGALPLTKADLDNFGERPIPQLCVICHGGQVASVAADPANPTGPKKGAFEDRGDIMSMGSSFLPFDLGLYNFPAANSKAAQQPSFKGLNEDIVKGVATANDAAGFPGAEIVELIDEFYLGGVPNQIIEPVVTDWDKANSGSDTNRFYRDVFGPTCRTCHISQPFSGPPYGTAADFHSDISTIQTRVCNQKVMPHAKRTHQIFWNSLDPNMPSFLELYGQTLPGWSDSPGSQCGQFYQAGSSPVSVYATEIQPIFDKHCASCHGAGGIASGTQFVVGTIADTYDGLIDNGLVTPFDLANSPLFQRLNAVGSSFMPQGGPDLEEVDEDNDAINDQDEIENWILSGAPGP